MQFLGVLSRFHARSRLFRNSHILFRYLWHICVCSWETKAGLLCFSSPPLTQLASCALLCHSFIQHRVIVVQVWLCLIYNKYSLTQQTKHFSISSLCHKPSFEIVVKYIGLMSQQLCLWYLSFVIDQLFVRSRSRSPRIRHIVPSSCVVIIVTTNVSWVPQTLGVATTAIQKP